MVHSLTGVDLNLGKVLLARRGQHRLARRAHVLDRPGQHLATRHVGDFRQGDLQARAHGSSVGARERMGAVHVRRTHESCIGARKGGKHQRMQAAGAGINAMDGWADESWACVHVRGLMRALEKLHAIVNGSGLQLGWPGARVQGTGPDGSACASMMELDEGYIEIHRSPSSSKEWGQVMRPLRDGAMPHLQALRLWEVTAPLGQAAAVRKVAHAAIVEGSQRAAPAQACVDA
eukprot:290804-Chlamydomonas_euryale.AAC.2